MLLRFRHMIQFLLTALYASSGIVMTNACSTIAFYTTGPQLLSALPEPDAAMETRFGGFGVTREEGTFVVSGRLKRIQSGPAPGYGFILEIERSSYETTILTVRTYTETNLDFLTGTSVMVFFSTDNGYEVKVLDEKGVVFFLYSGEGFPVEQKDLPIQANGSQKRVYSEVISASDMCKWTVIHEAISFDTGAESFYLPPGSSKIIKTFGQYFVVYAIDSRWTEDSDCGREDKEMNSYFFGRIAFGKVRAIKGVTEQ